MEYIKPIILYQKTIVEFSAVSSSERVYYTHHTRNEYMPSYLFNNSRYSEGSNKQSQHKIACQFLQLGCRFLCRLYFSPENGSTKEMCLE